MSTLLLVFAVLLYVMAAKYLAGGPDEDAPPPRWMTMVASASPGRAFLLGAGILAIGPKFWVFTLGAIAAIESAGLGQPGATLTFVAFVILAASIHLAVVGLAYAVPSRSGPVLASAAELLQRYNRAIMIVFGVVFGSWFLLKALAGFGVL